MRRGSGLGLGLWVVPVSSSACAESWKVRIVRARPRGDDLDLVDQTSLEAAVAADDAARAEAVATWLRAFVAHLLPKTAPVYAPDTASSGGAAAPETAPALAAAVTAAQIGAVTAAQIGAAAAADAASVLVLQLMTRHVLPALQRAAAAEGACAASEGLWEEASCALMTSDDL